jgi:predicted  nucleic acid-binding Zn-ribbon protein
MKANSQQQETLLDLGRIDLQLRRNQKLIAETESGVAVQAARESLLKNSESLLEVKNELDALALELGRAEVDLQLVDVRIEKDKQRLQQSSNQRDIQGIQSELASLQKRKDELEDAELQLLDRKEFLQNKLTSVEKERKELQDAVSQLESQQNSELAKLNSGQQLLREDRARGLGQLTVELAEHYEKLYAKGISVGRLSGLVCDACGMTLSGDSLDMIRDTPMDELAHCGECGAILVR